MFNNFKFHELRNHDSAYFQTIIKYCQEMFHCSIKDIKSLIGKLLAGENGQVKAHVIYTECLGELNGFAIFYYYPQHKIGFLEALVILENYRDLGIGSQLYWRMLDYMKEHYPECIGHLLELCQEQENYLQRKDFFLKQGCIPIDLNFFLPNPLIIASGLQMLYHPYRLNQKYSLQIMQDILREMGTEQVQ